MMRELPLANHLAFEGPERLDGSPAQERTTRLFAADPFEDRAEPFFELRDRLFETEPADPAERGAGAGRRAAMKGIIGILSPDPGDGRSHVAANLAAALAHGGARTLLIDGDVRHPRLHTLLHAPPRTGLGELLGETQEIQEGSVQRLGRAHVLSLLATDSAGPGIEPPILRQGPDLGQLLQHYRTHFDCVVLDTPPASSQRDALLIAAFCDTVIIVGRKGRTRMSDLRKLINRASRSGARIGGVIINEH